VERKKQKKISFILSLLVHLSLFLIFTFKAFKKSPLVQPANLKRPIQAMLLPKRSDMGTKVVFDDTFIAPTEQVANKEKSVAPPAKPQPAKPEPKEQELKKNVAEKSPDKTIIRKAQQKIAKSGMKKVERKTERKVVEKAPPIKAPPRKVPIRKALARRTSPRKMPVKKERPRKVQPKKKSLLALTKTFLDHPKGNSCLLREGESKFPSLEEMKYICYEKRIHDEILATWNSLYRGVYTNPNRGVRFTYCISEGGKAEGLALLESSGDAQFDNMVLTCIRESVFPPIPKHFNVKKYRPRGHHIVVGH